MKVKMRLMLVGGTLMMVLTAVIVMYGFKRTEELQVERQVEVLMKEPRNAPLGDTPVGLTLGPSGDSSVNEKNAIFDDGLLVTLIGVENRPCSGCGPAGEPVAFLRLSGGHISKGSQVTARISFSSPDWRDDGYYIRLLDIDASGSVVFSAKPAP